MNFFMTTFTKKNAVIDTLSNIAQYDLLSKLMPFFCVAKVRLYSIILFSDYARKGFYVVSVQVLFRIAVSASIFVAFKNKRSPIFSRPTSDEPDNAGISSPIWVSRTCLLTRAIKFFYISSGNRMYLHPSGDSSQPASGFFGNFAQRQLLVFVSRANPFALRIRQAPFSHGLVALNKFLTARVVGVCPSLQIRASAANFAVLRDFFIAIFTKCHRNIIAKECVAVN